jgi:hypothetical protein
MSGHLVREDCVEKEVFKKLFFKVWLGAICPSVIGASNGGTQTLNLGMMGQVFNHRATAADLGPYSQHFIFFIT